MALGGSVVDHVLKGLFTDWFLLCCFFGMSLFSLVKVLLDVCVCVVAVV